MIVRASPENVRLSAHKLIIQVEKAFAKKVNLETIRRVLRNADVHLQKKRNDLLAVKNKKLRLQFVRNYSK